MSQNVFDQDDAEFYVLVNAERQYSLWPTFAAVPDGWSVDHGPAGRQECLDRVEAVWTDMRPASLVAATDGTARGAGA
jgi:MbtH protein